MEKEITQKNVQETDVKKVRCTIGPYTVRVQLQQISTHK